MKPHEIPRHGDFPQPAAARSAKTTAVSVWAARLVWKGHYSAIGPTYRLFHSRDQPVVTLRTIDQRVSQRNPAPPLHRPRVSTATSAIVAHGGGLGRRAPRKLYAHRALVRGG